MIVKVVILSAHMPTYYVKLSVVEEDVYFAVALVFHAAPLAPRGLDSSPFPGRGSSHGGGVVHVRDTLLRPAVHNSAGATEVAGHVAVNRL